MLLGKVFVSCFGDSSSDPSASDELVKNARKFAERCALEARFRRRSSRAGVPNTHASRLELDAPSYQASAVWLAGTASNELRLSKEPHVQMFRFAGRAPAPLSLRGALEGEELVRQVAAPAAALVFLLVSVRLTPTASYRNRAMLTEVITRAFEVRDQKMACESAEKQWVESPCPRGWDVNLVLDAVAGSLAFSLVGNKPGGDDAMLQFFVGGTAPGLGEKHYAFASDCLPRAPSNGSFAV